MISLTFLQLARIRARPQNRLIHSLDNFVEGVQRKLTTIESEISGVHGLTDNVHRELPDE